MFKQCTCLVFLIVALALIPGGTAYAWNPLQDPALAGWWSFDEGAGNTAADSSPHGRNGTLTGGATWAEGRFGGGIQLDGTSGYVSVPGFQLTTNAITMVTWIKGWKANDWAAIITGHPTRLELGFGDNNTLHYTWNNDAPATWSWAGGPVVPQDSWAMLAVTIDPAQAIAYVYTDEGGLRQGTNALAHIQQTFSVLQIGWSFGNRYVRGIVDEVAIYSRALTEEEILILSKGPKDPALAGDPKPANKALLEFGQTYYWRIDEVNAPPEHDLQGRGLVLHRRAVCLSDHRTSRPPPPVRRTAAGRRTPSTAPGSIPRTSIPPTSTPCGSARAPGPTGSSTSSTRSTSCTSCGSGTTTIPSSRSSAGAPRMSRSSTRSTARPGPSLRTFPSSPRPRPAHLHAQHDRLLRRRVRQVRQADDPEQTGARWPRRV
jgi:hypothetical protein